MKILYRYLKNFLRDLRRDIYSYFGRNFKRGTYKSGKYSFGIQIIGFASLAKGVGESVRSHIRAINILKFNNSVIDLKEKKTFEVKNYYKYNLFHINADLVPEMYFKLGKNFWEDKYNIGFWLWELEKFPSKWMNSFDYFDEIWVCSDFIYECLKKVSPIPVLKVPISINVKTDEKYNRGYFKLPKEQFLFLSMYDTNSVQERKNPKASIKAFQMAFKKDSKVVGMVVKVNNAEDRQNEIKEIEKMILGWENIYLICENLSKPEVNGLINSCDSFISLHRSEGFGLVIAEFMYLGKPVIVTDWSGNIDFTNEENSCCVSYDFIELKENFGPYEKGNRWAEANIEEAGEYMKKLVNDKEYYNQKSKLGKQFIKSNFSDECIAGMIRDRIFELENKKG